MKLLLLLLFTLFVQHDFLAQQKTYNRVRTAFTDKEVIVNKLLASKNIKQSALNILLVAYKQEQLLEVYAKNTRDKNYVKLITYPICASSGELGPKRQQGDGQVPEGFYTIANYNPASSYYLSLGLNYPNKADRIKSTATNLGGDIFIHGECVTIGCLPMTNDKIKEIYLLAILAHNNKQIIPVCVFPFKLTTQNIASYTATYKGNTALLHFWNNLKTGYDTFTKTQQELNVTVDDKGNYQF